MAEKSSSRIRYDDIVGAVHADPANAEPMVMLSGYLGKSAEDGNLRIYPDASLGHWYEVAEGDVVHSRPIADSALGGSNVWVKASAKITPGVATAPRPAEGEEGEGGEAAAQPLPDTGVFNPLATIHPTLWTQIGCHTQLPGCGLGGIHPTIWTQIGCSTQAGCIETISCLPPGGFGAQAYAARPQTAGVGCPDTISCTPQHISLPGCVHTGGVGCPDTISCPPGAALAKTIGICHTLGFTCTLIDCPQLGAQAQISLPGCVHTGGVGCSDTVSCTPPHISVPGCLPPRTIGCPVLSVPGCLPPQTLGCPQAIGHTAATVCTQYGCPPQGGSTAATVCTQYGCPHPGNTAATVCTQFGCPQPGGEANAAQVAQAGASSVFGCSMICSVFVTCSPLCAREAAPAQAYPVSVPGNCPTVGPQCQLLSAPPHCPTVAPPCGLLSAPPHCPTVAPPCGLLSAPPNCPMPPTHLLGCPSTHTCPPTNMYGCPSSQAGCPPTHLLGCPSSHAGCPPQGGYATFPYCP